MRRWWHRPLAASGAVASLVSCSQPSPTAHRGRAETAAPVPSTGTADSAAGPGDSEVAPTSSPPPGPAAPTSTTVTVTLPTVPSTTTTLVLPEHVDEDQGDIEWLIRQTFPETPEKAVRIARCESRFDPTAVSPDGANWGVMQVNVVHKGLAAAMGYSWGQMLQVLPNLAVARAVYDRAGGWGPWSCR